MDEDLMSSMYKVNKVNFMKTSTMWEIVATFLANENCYGRLRIASFYNVFFIDTNSSC
ncbi:MAG TPA: hypothetical protein VF047_05350 [Nitrososphaeraceae archaeon]